MNCQFDQSCSVEKDKQLYLELKKKGWEEHRLGNTEKALEYIQTAASLAWSNCFIWSDSDLEQLLFQIGKEIKNQFNQNKCSRSKSNGVQSVLFITSFLAKKGGHSEVLKQWLSYIQHDFKNITVYATHVGGKHKRTESVSDYFENSKVGLIQSDHKASYTNRIRDLTNYILKNEIDRIILFTSPDDIVVTSSLLSLDKNPPVIYYNHADHVFWLGVDCLDYLIEHRTAGAWISQNLRSASSSGIINLTATPVEKSSGPFPSIPKNKTVSTSVGSWYKIRSSGGPDYFETISKILNKNPDHHHVLVTKPPSKNEIRNIRVIDNSIRNRLHIVGPYNDLSGVYTESDFLIDTFPYSGGQVRFEAIANSVPIIVYKHEEFPFLTDVDAIPEDYRYQASEEQDFIDLSTKFINERSELERVGRDLQKYFLSNFSEDMIGKNVHDLFIDPKRWTSEQELEISTKNYFSERNYAEFCRSDFTPNATLLLNSCKKESGFSQKDRIILWLCMARCGDAKNILDFFAFLFIAVTGGTGYQCIKRVQRFFDR